MACYFPGLDAIKTFNVIDNNGNSLNDLGDLVVYTVTVTNTGILPLKLTQVTDNLRADDGSSISSLTLEFTSVSSNSLSSVATNMFKYSNFINHDNNNSRWKEQGNVSGQTENWLNWTPANIDYYFNTNSGRNYNEVNSWFTTDGFGTTPNNDSNPGQTALYSTRKVNTTDGSGANKLNNYNYQDVALKPNTTYTISAWISRGQNTSNVNRYNDPFHFVIWQGSSGTGNPIEYSQGFVPSSYYNAGVNGFERVSYTFTTGASIGATSRAGFSPGYNNNFGTHIWGMQLEEGAAAGRYIFSHTNVGVMPGGLLGYFDPRSSYLPAGAVATFTTTLTLTQDILNQTGKLVNSVDFTGSFTTPGGISGSVTETSDDNDDTDGNIVDDPTETILSNTAGIKLTKTFSVNDKNKNGLNDVGDIITYSLNVSNTGNVGLSSLTVTDTLSDLSGNQLQVTQTSSMTISGKLNLFKYSNYLVFNQDQYWKNENGNSYHNYNYDYSPRNIEYYLGNNTEQIIINWMPSFLIGVLEPHL